MTADDEPIGTLSTAEPVSSEPAQGQKYLPYPEYKESGVEWLGEIPAHWEVKMLKRLAAMQAGCTITSESIEPIGDYPVFGGNGIRGFADSFTHDGEFPLIGRQGALCGCVNLASGKFWASEHAVVARPAQTVDALWLARLLATMPLNTYSQSAAQPGLAVDTIGAIRAPVPPLLEQHAIADFLDRETGRIDRLIEKKQRLLELLEEKRTALITHAVTRGLDPDVPLKTSGVEWLGTTPEHWELVRNGQMFLERDERGYPDLPILSVSIHDGATVRQFSDERIEQQAKDRSTYKRALRADIVFNKMRMWQGAVGVAPCEGLISPDYLVAEPDTARVEPRFIEQLFRTPLYQGESYRHSHGIVDDRNRLYWDEFKEMTSVLPPLGEQQAIADHLDRETKRLDALADEIRHARDLHEERRTALISATVTGKIDVGREMYDELRHVGHVFQKLQEDLELISRSLKPSYVGLYEQIELALAPVRQYDFAIGRATALRDAVSRQAAEIASASRQWQQMIDQLVTPSPGLADLARTHETWLASLKPTQNQVDQLEAAVKLSLGNVAYRAAISGQLFAGLDFEAIGSTVALPGTNDPALRDALIEMAATYNRVAESIRTVPDITQLPAYVLPGATRELFVAGHVVDAFVDRDKALEDEEASQTQVVAEMEAEASVSISLLQTLDPALATPYVGAREALRGANPDRVRHVLSSLRELWSHVLRRIAPDEQVLEWVPNDRQELLHKGRPTRRARVLYVCRNLDHEPLGEFIDADTRALVKLVELFNRAHELESDLTDEQLRALLLRTESWLAYILQIWGDTR